MQRSEHLANLALAATRQPAPGLYLMHRLDRAGAVIQSAIMDAAQRMQSLPQWVTAYRF